MCSTATRISGAREERGEEEQQGKMDINNCYYFSYTVK